MSGLRVEMLLLFHYWVEASTFVSHQKCLVRTFIETIVSGLCPEMKITHLKLGHYVSLVLANSLLRHDNWMHFAIGHFVL